ncbi:MAG: DUF420 domain-containing protein [Bacteroidia bacterium]|nr:DUF420 domain-containing protein [Bacteroidia bacterium]MCZ2276566.1 DUF420 domain-containing protein [Bacteroidia bacterium]
MNKLSRFKSVYWLISFISLAVVAAVIVFLELPKSDHIPGFVYELPKLNAVLSASCSCLLLVSVYLIRKKKVSLHKKLNFSAFLLSCLFLISYLTFHSYGIEVRFPADNPLRPYYLFILGSHILLAPVVLPLVLLSFYFGLTKQIKKHKAIGRWAMPIWLYVTITGVVVYLMISPYYQF